MAASGLGALGARVQEFIHRKNLDHYRRLLADEPDEAQRALLLQLLERDEMRVETLGQADGYVEPRGDRLTGIALNQDRLVSHGGLRIALEATYEIKTSSGLICIKLPYPLDHIMSK